MVTRGVDLAKSAFHVASRGAERVLPPIALWFLLWPLNEAVAARQAWRSRERVPASMLPLPATTGVPSYFKRWRHFRRAQTHWWLLGWMDRLPASKWRRRLEIHDLEKLTAVLAERPVIVCSIHTTSVPTLAAWLRSFGIPTAHVPVDMTWFSSPSRLRKAALAARMGGAFVIRPDRPRDMVEFLKPGNMLLLTADFTGGRVTNVPWRNGSVSVGIGLFRLARSTGAAVVPVLIFDIGRWRYKVTVFDPVPQELITAGNTAAAANHVVECLLPLAAERPEQAMEVLLGTVS
ncbi:MAG: Bacterial lipid biosynthesis acyltransferase [Chloroflexota bacterium]|jgi:lauroyl/myristoyl acyltransferase|nr:Bacterial lipid biosynthesis acyltransferase [Chloroflexota bacterium]